MRAEGAPAGLYSHPAWMAWKETRGWRQLDGGLGFRLLVRRLGPGASMAYRAAPLTLPCLGDRPAEERGAALERLSQRLLPRLPEDCVFIRWDLMQPAWTGEGGAPLETRLQELRMNASTAWRRLRKAPEETTCADSLVVDLDGPGATASRMDARTRYSVRLALRRGTRVLRAGRDGLAAFHRLYAETAARKGFEEHPASAFQDLFSAAAAHGLRLDLYLAECPAGIAAGAITAIHRAESWYLFAASSAALRPAAGPSAVLHRALLDAADAGARRMDLLGAAPAGAPRHPLAGITAFKSGFGGRRITRAGAWDFVLRPDRYARWIREETLRSSVPAGAPGCAGGSAVLQ